MTTYYLIMYIGICISIWVVLPISMYRNYRNIKLYQLIRMFFIGLFWLPFIPIVIVDRFLEFYKINRNKIIIGKK